MTNNDILRRLRYTLDLDTPDMVNLFQHVEYEATSQQIQTWLKKETDPDYKNCSDRQLALFLNGLIIEKRGKRPGPMPKAEQKLNNNLILMKLKIAFNLQSDQIIDLLALAGLPISPHELSAFFRRADHKHYRLCKDQILRNFLMGLQLHHRPKKSSDSTFNWPERKPT